MSTNIEPCKLWGYKTRYYHWSWFRRVSLHSPKTTVFADFPPNVHFPASPRAATPFPLPRTIKPAPNKTYSAKTLFPPFFTAILDSHVILPNSNRFTCCCFIKLVARYFQFQPFRHTLASMPTTFPLLSPNHARTSVSRLLIHKSCDHFQLFTRVQNIVFIP